MPTIRSDKSSVQRRMYYLRFFFCFAVSHCLCTCIRICICTIYVSSSVLLFPIAFALVFVFVFLRILEFTTHWRLEICIVWFWSVLLFTTRKNNWYYPVINTISNITIFMTVYVLFRVLGQFCCWPRRMYSPWPGRASGSSGPDMTQTLWAMSTCLCAACVYTNTWNTYNYMKITKTNTKAQTWHRL